MRQFVKLMVVVLVIASLALSVFGCSAPATPTTAPAPATSASTSAPAAATTSAPAAATTSAAATTAAATTSAAAAAASGAKEIVIGAPIALTGDSAGFGEGNKFALEQAVADVNKLGGIEVKDLGKKLPVRLVIRDDESDPNKGATIAEQLIVGDKVNFIVRGLEPPHIGAPIATVCEKYGMIMLTGVGPYEAWIELRKTANPVWKHTWTPSFAIATPEPDKTDFRFNQPGYTMMEAWSPILPKIEGKVNKKVAALASDEPDGRGWYLSFAPYMKDKGWEVYKADKEFGLVPQATNDFAPLIKEWMTAGCDTVWSNCTGPFFGTFWRQANTLGFKPKVVFASRSGLFFNDIKAWGGDLPQAICNEKFWVPQIAGSVGFGTVTSKDLDEAWKKATNQPTHPLLGYGYAELQVLADAIGRAGSLDTEKVQTALAKTDMQTMYGRIQFDSEQFSRVPCFFGQWQKGTNPWVWDNPIVISNLKEVPVGGDLIFPIPYK